MGLEHRAAALERAKRRLACARVDGIDWYWPAAESPRSAAGSPTRRVRLLTPFDPVVWDRRRFEIFWGWPYRFEAYTPAPKRKLGYYALPLLWRERVIGWGNLTVTGGPPDRSFGYVGAAARPRERRVSRTASRPSSTRMRVFLRSIPRQVRKRPVSRCTKSDWR